MSKAKRVCPTCKTTKFRKSADSGLVCKYGHKVLGIQLETTEDDGFAGGRGLRRKTVSKVKESKQLSPAQQKSEFMLITQYALQVFSRCMVQDLNFPPELEPTVRELWLLYLSDAKKEISEAYMFEAFEKEAEDKIKSKKDEFDLKLEQEELALDDTTDDSSSDDDDYVEEEDEGRANKVPIKKSNKAQRDPKTQRYKSERNKWAPLNYIHTLCFIYLACVYLQYPILPNDLIRWCKTSQIPYLSIQQRIPEEKLSMLSLHLTNTMTYVPSVEKIVVHSYKLARCYLVNCKLQFPNFNIPLYLDRFCSQFFLPVEGYFYANMLFQNRTRVVSCITHREYQLAQPTTVLMACVIATAKIIYGIGDIYNVTSKYVSEYDVRTTRETWLNLIRENLSRWKKLDDEEDELENVISLIKGVTVARKAGAFAKDKQNVILNIMNQSVSEDNIQIGPPKRPISQINMLMDTYDLARSASSNAPSEAELIKQGYMYYRRKNGFAPNDYLKILELAALITGETTNTHLEASVKEVDTWIFNSQPNEVTNLEQFKERFLLSS